MTLFSVLVVGCTALPIPSPTVAVLELPSPAPSELSDRPVIDEDPNSVTLAPVSRRALIIGATYAYTMPPCGASGPIDIDGSFWDEAVEGSRSSAAFDGVTGTFRLTSLNSAEFVTADRRVLRLERHVGPKVFFTCS